MTARAWLSAPLLALTVTACGSDGDASLTELQRVQAGELNLVLLSENGAIGQNGDAFVLEFRSAADGALVEVGRAKAAATMLMPGMSPMFGDVTLEPTEEPGRFRATGDFSMAGSWRLSVDWDGPAGSGSTTISTTVR